MLGSKNILIVLIAWFSIQSGISQIQYLSPYFPEDQTGQTDWKWQVSSYAEEASNSNNFINEFFSAINKSEYIDDELKQKQVDLLNGVSLAGQVRTIGGRVLFNSKNDAGNQFFYLGIEHQRFLDIKVDNDLVKLILMGNKPYAGQILNVRDTRYYNLYYNQLKGGMGFCFKGEDSYHQLAWGLALNIGQNYNLLTLQNASLFTQEQGDYIDIEASIKTRLSDTVWAEVYEMRGLGFSGDIEYAFTKPGNFHMSFMMKNLGSILWNSNPYYGEKDTSFVFDGFAIDTSGSQQNNLNNDFSYENLRNQLFKNPETGSFSTFLPVNFRFSAGKYFSSDKFYTGLNTSLFPFHSGNYYLEMFCTYNHQKKFFITPLLLYSSFGKFNYGLHFGFMIGEKLSFQAGSGYLNSTFGKKSTLGQGGIFKITYRN
ncbi:MAG: hypothetical protein K8R53_04710 [Bacteroidales bacterium]|nr:hypothetical protein [Bacteroidales bacterium]